MKAAVYYESGGPDVFRYEDVPDPHVAEDQVLPTSSSIGELIAFHRYLFSQWDDFEERFNPRNLVLNASCALNCFSDFVQ